MGHYTGNQENEATREIFANNKTIVVIKIEKGVGIERIRQRLLPNKEII